MQAQVDSGVSFGVAGATTFIGFMFGLDPRSLLAAALMAFVGSCIAIGSTNSMTYRRALQYAVGGVLATLALLPVLIAVAHHYQPEIVDTIPVPPLAAIIAFVLVFFRKQILKRIGIQINETGVSQ